MKNEPFQAEPIPEGVVPPHEHAFEWTDGSGGETGYVVDGVSCEVWWLVERGPRAKKPKRAYCPTHYTMEEVLAVVQKHAGPVMPVKPRPGDPCRECRHARSQHVTPPPTRPGMRPGAVYCKQCEFPGYHPSGFVEQLP